MTDALYRSEPYLAEAPATVTALTPEGGIVLDRTIFYPTGGGQPGDSGWLDWQGGRIAIATTLKAEGGAALVPAAPVALPPAGAAVVQRLDWGRRHRHMRVHTALHLLSVVIPLPVTGGQIGAERGRLDFLMPDPLPGMSHLEEVLNGLIDRDYAVSEQWVDEAALEADPGLVKTMSVRPPAGQGRIRLIRIGDDARQVDLQPCGGTHVARTAEIGRISLGKPENKGRQNRRVTLTLME